MATTKTESLDLAPEPAAALAVPLATPRLQRNAGKVQGCSSCHVQTYSRCRDARSHLPVVEA